MAGELQYRPFLCSTIIGRCWPGVLNPHPASICESREWYLQNPQKRFALRKIFAILRSRRRMGHKKGNFFGISSRTAVPKPFFNCGSQGCRIISVPISLGFREALSKEENMRKARLWVVAMAVGCLLAPLWSCSAANDAPRLDKETLKSWLADPQVLIIDVRAAGDWQGSAKKIKGAVRENPKDVKTWAAKLAKEKKIVLYCA
jgi:hypothetical protein